MTSTFHALEVGTGEAFLLTTLHDTEEITILVDSGYCGRRLVDAICMVSPTTRHIDMAVCTHHDNDHSKGFQTFADEWEKKGGTIGEFWLPGRWAAAVPMVLSDPLKLAEWVAEEASQLSRKWRDDGASSARDFAERFRQSAPVNLIREAFDEVSISGDDVDPPKSELEASQVTREGKVALGLGVAVDRLEELDAGAEETGRIWEWLESRHGFDGDHFYHPWFLPFDSTAAYMFWDVMRIAKSISDISRSALRGRIPIRWFDFDLFEQTGRPRGGNPYLRPLSSVELARPPRTSSAVLFFSLSLSRQNVESLVFLRPETCQEPSVLFTGDSRLCFGVNKPGKAFPSPAVTPKRMVLITAPHHGSRVNDAAYGVISTWFGVTHDHLYIRNGGHWKQTLGLFATQTNRWCACCVQCRPKVHQAVTVLSSHGKWGHTAIAAAPC